MKRQQMLKTTQPAHYSNALFLRQANSIQVHYVALARESQVKYKPETEKELNRKARSADPDPMQKLSMYGSHCRAKAALLIRAVTSAMMGIKHKPDSCKG